MLILVVCLLNICSVPYLILVSVVWSLSFGVFKTRLVTIDPNLTAFLRLSLAFLFFLPFLRLRKISVRQRWVYFFVGMLQYGVMYMCLNRAFAYLSAWQVALMTLFTPIYIVLIHSIWKRRFEGRFLLAASLAVAGAAVAMYSRGCVPPKSLVGCLLVQGSDISFAIGVLIYRSMRRHDPGEVRDHELFAILLGGALLLALVATLCAGSFPTVSGITSVQWWALVYMGTVSTALCFFLWNYGSTKVSTGILAVMSNIKVPLAIAVSMFLFSENAGDWYRLLAGVVLMAAAVLLAQKHARHIA